MKRTHEQTDGDSSHVINLVITVGYEQSNNNQGSRQRKIWSNKDHPSQNPPCKKKKLSWLYCNKLDHIMKNCHIYSQVTSKRF